jgi:hypothetical protein
MQRAVKPLRKRKFCGAAAIYANSGANFRDLRRLSQAAMIGQCR